MFDLGIAKDQEIEHRKKEEEDEEKDENKELPLYNQAAATKRDFIEHPYNLRPRNWEMANYKAILVSHICRQIVPLCLLS